MRPSLSASPEFDAALARAHELGARYGARVVKQAALPGAVATKSLSVSTPKVSTPGLPKAPNAASLAEKMTDANTINIGRTLTGNGLANDTFSSASVRNAAPLGSTAKAASLEAYAAKTANVLSLAAKGAKALTKLPALGKATSVAKGAAPVAAGAALSAGASELGRGMA